MVDGVREGLPVAVPGPVTLGDAVARGLPDAVGLGLLEAVGVGLRVVTGLAVPLGVRDAEHVRVPQRVPEATNSHRSGRGGGGLPHERARACHAPSLPLCQRTVANDLQVDLLQKECRRCTAGTSHCASKRRTNRKATVQ